MLTSLAFLLAALQNPAEKVVTPTVIAGVVKPGRCRIPIAVAGKSYLFLVDTGLEKSYIRPDVKAYVLKLDKKATLSLAGGSIAISDLPSPEAAVYTEIPAVGGIIGMDILSKVAFGIDYDKQQLTLWPTDAKQSDIETSFFPAPQKFSSIPLITEPGYVSQFLQTSLGEAELDTGASVGLLAKSAASSPEVFATSLSRPLQLFDGTAGHASQAVVRHLKLGDVDVFCQQFLLSDTADVGVVAASVLGRRVLFDFPDKRVSFVSPSDEERGCSAIGSLLHGTVMAKNGELYLKAQMAKNLGATKNPWVRVVSIDGRKGSEWLSMFLRRDDALAGELRNAYDSLAKNGKVIVERNGKQETLLISPFINP